MNLRLNLKAKWYDMIESGEKKEEYRQIKPYWEKRLYEYVIDNGVLKGVKIKSFDTVTFVYGYTKRTMTFKIIDITIGKGNPEWGGIDEDVFIIKIGDRIEL